MHASQRRGMLAIVSLVACCGSNAHSCSKACWSSWRVPGGYQDLSDFERGVIIGAREMGHSISEVALKFGFSRTTISRVYREYRISGKTSNFRYRCGRKKTLKELDH
ncbi:hypothetical protein AVEN_59639-1 [Araneus ventricosus]|uniref:Tc3 transposase DNA binding domain-containing protein n=1 Tax=Araneus ventricosus TaxID=182803 RepID=A0A4Y2MQL9_ARAVE|nr:hypothetical protein AVEN_59639-1 [Araneus ventricosus]